LIRGQWIRRDPAAAGEFVEVHARVYGPVEILQVESGIFRGWSGLLGKA
jgi:hypothetical protein